MVDTRSRGKRCHAPKKFLDNTIWSINTYRWVKIHGGTRALVIEYMQCDNTQVSLGRPYNDVTRSFYIFI